MNEELSSLLLNTENEITMNDATNHLEEKIRGIDESPNYLNINPLIKQILEAFDPGTGHALIRYLSYLILYNLLENAYRDASKHYNFNETAMDDYIFFQSVFIFDSMLNTHGVESFLYDYKDIVTSDEDKRFLKRCLNQHINTLREPGEETIYDEDLPF